MRELTGHKVNPANDKLLVQVMSTLAARCCSGSGTSPAWCWRSCHGGIRGLSPKSGRNGCGRTLRRKQHER